MAQHVLNAGQVVNPPADRARSRCDEATATAWPPSGQGKHGAQ